MGKNVIQEQLCDFSLYRTRNELMVCHVLSDI